MATARSMHRRRAAGVTVLAAVVCVPALTALAPQGDAARHAATAEVADLAALTSLAEGDAFYLVLDPAAGHLRLMFRGAELVRYAVQDVRVGQPTFMFLRRPVDAGWQGRAWTAGRLDPIRAVQREEIDPSNAEDEVRVPPTPEEAYPAPHRYQLRFADGPSLEVRPSDADAAAGAVTHALAWWRTYWADLGAALFTPADERVRLRLILSPADAGALYRALPPDVGLLVLGTPAAAPDTRATR